MTVSREQLESDLQDAESNADTALRQLVGASTGPDRDEIDRAYENARVLAASIRRELATLTGEEHAILLDIGVRPECAVSSPVLMQTDRHCILLFNARTSGDGERVPQAVVKFDYAIKTQFGLPNDDALDGHPLAKRGLEAYDIFEVANSSWLAQEQARNQVRFPDFRFAHRHFIFTFHDSSFECLARDYSVKIDDRPFIDIWSELLALANEA